MNARTRAIALALFLSGAAVGSLVAPAIAPARADAIDWKAVAKDPAFRAAVVEVIDSCLVENGFIYCN